MEKAMFIQEGFRVTQSSNSQAGYSHHNRQAYDFAYASNRRVYTPYKCIVKKYEPFGTGSKLHAVFIESAENVEGPSGRTGKQWMILLHADSIHQKVVDSYTNKTTIAKNTYFYDEGTYDGYIGGVAKHVHIQCGWGSVPTTSWGSKGGRIEDCLFLPEGIHISSDSYHYGGDRITFQTASGEKINTGGGTNPGSGGSGGGNTGGTTEPEPPRWVDEATFLAAVAERNRRQVVLDDLRLNKLSSAELDLKNAQWEYNFRRQFQTIHEKRLADTQKNAETLCKENEQKLAGLHTNIADLFQKTKAAVVQSIMGLRQRIHDKLEAIRKRLQEAMSPTTGVRGSLDALVEDLFGQHRGDALQAGEYDDKELDAPVYDARDLLAFTYDAEGKLHI